ncbi:MAG: hypothetical protein ACI4PE_05365 [Bacilli bacterium]
MSKNNFLILFSLIGSLFLFIGSDVASANLESPEASQLAELQEKFPDVQFEIENGKVVSASSDTNDLTEVSSYIIGLEKKSNSTNPKSRASDDFRYDSDNKSSANIYTLAQVQGNYVRTFWENSWENVAGSGIGRWEGSGTVKKLWLKQTLSISGTSVTISWPPSFTSSSDKIATRTSSTVKTNSHAMYFSEGDMSSTFYLGGLTLSNTTNVVDPNGYDGSATIQVAIEE